MCVFLLSDCLFDSDFFVFFNHPATPEIYTLSLHDALPIFPNGMSWQVDRLAGQPRVGATAVDKTGRLTVGQMLRSEEHTSELQSRQYLVCRLLLEKKKRIYGHDTQRRVAARLRRPARPRTV